MQPSVRATLVPMYGRKVVDRLERELEYHDFKLPQRWGTTKGLPWVQLDGGTDLVYYDGVWRSW